MDCTAGISVYSLHEPHAVAVRTLHAALTQAGLRIVVEHDVAARIARELRVRLAACYTLYVWPNALLSAEDALALPLHVVVAGCGERTEIYVPAQIDGSAEHTALASTTHAELVRALDRIAMRAGVV